MKENQVFVQAVKGCFSTPVNFCGITEDNEHYFVFFCVEYEEEREAMLKIIDLEQQYGERISPIFLSRSETKDAFPEVFNTYLCGIISTQNGYIEQKNIVPQNITVNTSADDLLKLGRDISCMDHKNDQRFVSRDASVINESNSGLLFLAA